MAGKEDAIGGELIFDWMFYRQMRLNGSYSYVEVSDELYQKIPMHLVKLNLDLRFLDDKLRFALNYIYNNSMKELEQNDGDFDDAYMQDNHLFNLYAGYEVYKGVDLNLKIHNLFETDFPPFTANIKWPGNAYLGSDERRIYAGISAKF